jgi:hypothetical protein
MPINEGVRRLVPGVPPTQKLARSVGRDGTQVFSIENRATNPHALEQGTTISTGVFEILLRAEAQWSIEKRQLERKISDPSTLLRESEELIALWSARRIRLLPASKGEQSRREAGH